jgi:hypothetical protein
LNGISSNFPPLLLQILIFCSHDGLLFLAYVLLWGTRSPDVATDNYILECHPLCPIDYLLLFSFKESCKFFSRYVVLSSMCSVLNMEDTNSTAWALKERHKYIVISLSNYLNVSRLLLKHDKSGNYILDDRSAMLAVMDLFEYIIEFSFSWLYCDTKSLLIMINPVLATSVNGDSFQVLLDQLMHAICHKNHDISSSTGGMPHAALSKTQLKKSVNSNLLADEKWHLIGASVWVRLISVLEHRLREFFEKEGLEHEAGVSGSEFRGLITSVAAKFVMDSIHFVSSSLVPLHASFLRKNLPMNSSSSLLFWLESKLPQQLPVSDSYDHLSRISQLSNSENMEALFNILWEISVNPMDVCNAFVSEGVNCFSLSNTNVTRSWKDIRCPVVECDKIITERSGEEHEHRLGSKRLGQGFAEKASYNGEVLYETKRRELIIQKEFQSPREILRRSGELLEVFNISLLTL